MRVRQWMWAWAWVSGVVAIGCGRDQGGQPHPQSAETTATVSAPLASVPQSPSFAIEARWSLVLRDHTEVLRGNVGTRDSNAAAMLMSGFEVAIFDHAKVETTQHISGDSVYLGPKAIVGDLQTNALSDLGAKHGTVAPFTSLPDLPALGPVQPGASPLTVDSHATVNATAGAWSTLTVKDHAKVRLAAGLYQVGDLVMQEQSRLEATGTVEIRVAGRLDVAAHAFVGAAPGVKLTARDIRIQVAGVNGATGGVNETPKSAQFAEHDEVHALLLAPNGTLVVGAHGLLFGALAAREVDLGEHTKLTWEDGFPSEGCAAGCDDGNACTVDACMGGSCAHEAAADGTACDDGNACTQADACAAGVCVAGTPVVCAASDACHAAGACDPVTGACSNPTVADGTACDDGNACTRADSCAAGTCVGSNPVICTATDVCHLAGACDPATGVCSHPMAPAGAACSDGNPCNGDETCDGTGECRPGVAPNLDDGDPCTVDTCDPVVGVVHHACSAIDATVASTIAQTTSFLHTGSNPVQIGVAAGTIDARRAAVLRGRVLDRQSSPLSGVTVSIVGHLELGTTTTAADGTFSMAANGGATLVVSYAAVGYATVQRTAEAVPWNDYRILPDVVLIPLDSAATTIDTSGGAGYQVARASTVSDADGTRTATLLVPAGVAAQIRSGVSTTPVASLSIRATEYTVGGTGPKAMPGELPPNVGYTYAIELSADEALSPGERVEFTKPLVSYTDNFLHFKVGQPVPAAYYDYDRSQWVPSTDGRVLEIVGVTGGRADLDITGDGVADSTAALAALGITDDERAQLAELYPASTSLWRVTIPHFCAWDFNWPFAPPPGSQPPNPPPPGPPDPLDQNCEDGGSGMSRIECQNQLVHESVPLAGTPFSLVYSSDRATGYAARNRLVIPLVGATVPASASRIDVEIAVAGRVFTESFAPLANEQAVFDWDGRDAYGRLVRGVQVASISIGYVYPGVYLTPSERPGSSYDALFGHFSYYGTPATGDRTRQEVTLWKRSEHALGHFDATGLGLGGWSLDVQHLYDVSSRAMLFGDGRRQHSTAFGRVASTVAGTGTYGFGGDGGPATSARFASPCNVAIAADGTMYIADRDNGRIRKIDNNGIVTTVAGGGGGGDGVAATQASLANPEAVIVGPDGSLYIGDVAHYRVRKVSPNGIITTVAGTGVSGYSGDGGPATAARLNNPNGLFLAPDGTLYIADSANAAVRKVDPGGIISTVAGTGVAGYNGDGIAAASARLGYPHSMVLTPEGTLLIVDRTNHRVRAIGPDGIIRTIAGTGVAGYSGDGGPAVQAQLSQPQNIVRAKDGTLYLSDRDNRRIRAILPDGTITTVAGTGGAGFGGDGGPALDAVFNP